PELVDGGRVSWNFFDTLGAKPILGRTFTAEDDRSGAPHVAILSQGLWQGRYAGDPKIIGRNIAIGGEAYTVVGVMPGTFQFPLMGVANLWTPLALTDKQRADRNGTWLPAFGRLKPGVTSGQAEAEMGAFCWSRKAVSADEHESDLAGQLDDLGYSQERRRARTDDLLRDCGAGSADCLHERRQSLAGPRDGSDEGVRRA